MTNDQRPLGIALIGFAILVCSMGVGRFAFTPILPIMEAEGLLTIREGGTLASAHFVGYAMGALLAGRLISSPQATLLMSLLGIAVATMAMGFTDSFAVWLFSRWVAGVFSALVLVVVSTYFVKRLAEIGRPDLQGWVFAGVGGGTALVGLAILGFMLTTAPSRMAWQVFGLATLAVAACIFFVLGRRSTVHATTGPSRDGQNDDTSTALAWHLILPYGAVGAGYIIPATYLPIMGQQAVSSPLIFGWAWPVFG
ncbi:MAG: YbfB/YjiJ family MFS transporter, partial [Geminicoccaceae bacterium]